MFLAACRPSFTPPDDAVTLPIADRPWDPAAPEEGWCGETSIQMAALHFGAWVPQIVANRLGRPKTPDLWEQDVPVALTALGLAFDTGPRRDPGALLAWSVEQLRLGRPVILGVKLVPSEHPEWDVDHLVLAVGFSREGLLINTNVDDGQVRATWNGLVSADGSYEMTLLNQQHETYGYAVRGFAKPTGARLEVREVDDAGVHLRAFLGDGGAADLVAPVDRVVKFGE